MQPSVWRRTPADVQDWFDEQAVARSRTYMRPVKRARLAAATASVVIIVAVIKSHLVPNLFRDIGIHGWVQEAAFAAVVLGVIEGVVAAPLSAWLELAHDKRWDLSTQTPGRWTGDQVKGLVIGSLLYVVLFVPIYWAIRLTSWWWLMAGGIVLVISLVFSLLGPVLIMPLFNKFVPLENNDLRESIDRIARQAGITIRGSFTMDASKRSRRDNAFVAGFGPTKRVVIFDTMLEYPQAAIEQVVAHELGHYRLKHIPKQVPVLVVTTIMGFATVDWILHWHWLLRQAGVHTLRDPGSLPLLLGALGLMLSITGLVDAWVTRAFERQADLEALRLLHDPAALIDMFRALATKNIGDLSPSFMTRAKASHPDIPERMAFAAAWSDAAPPSTAPAGPERSPQE